MKISKLFFVLILTTQLSLFSMSLPATFALADNSITETEGRLLRAILNENEIDLMVCTLNNGVVECIVEEISEPVVLKSEHHDKVKKILEARKAQTLTIRAPKKKSKHTKFVSATFKKKPKDVKASKKEK